ncbi:YciI family protein [Bacillus sp. FJAT-42315]|uniref:YciI family protein n=1 Tax=Bacillus sp. FJAT-42315 TaxID=2014077 RepID=UPI000C24BBDA|nr:YciI family protein [Bacillus sp. FJAT-42315]
MRFLVYYTHGEAWIAGKTTNEQPYINQHALHIQNRFNEGKIIFPGPFEDHTGGASLLEVANEEEAYDIINNDPLVKNKVVTAKLSPWEPIYNRHENSSPNFTREFFESQGIII